MKQLFGQTILRKMIDTFHYTEVDSYTHGREDSRSYDLDEEESSYAEIILK